MVRLFNILDYWAQLAQRSIALVDWWGCGGKSINRVRPDEVIARWYFMRGIRFGLARSNLA